MQRNNYREESPNLAYVVELAGTSDFDFEQKFVASLKHEFSMNLGKYLFHINRGEPRAAAEMVHKLKHKIRVLGMPKASDFAEQHEEKLHIGDTELDEDFKKILKTIDIFLKETESSMQGDYVG
ncbi:Hpt domain-containing protein [Maribacter algicola]|uniref:Hpt domain-containing protein n=1 Tax=Meishania litoralis TaxID=3434685 RepID=A0ACC7LHK6_9FLAO